MRDELISTFYVMEATIPQPELDEIMNPSLSHLVGIKRMELEIRKVSKASVYSSKLVEDIVAKQSLTLMESAEGRPLFGLNEYSRHSDSLKSPENGRGTSR